MERVHELSLWGRKKKPVEKADKELYGYCKRVVIINNNISIPTMGF